MSKIFATGKKMLEDLANEGKSLRHNAGKLKWSLMHYKSMECLIEVLMLGANQYGIDNWKIGLDLKEIQESIQRHLASLMDGELKDKDTNLFHVGHIMANCMFWMYHYNKQQMENSK